MRGIWQQALGRPQRVGHVLVRQNRAIVSALWVYRSLERQKPRFWPQPDLNLIDGSAVLRKWVPHRVRELGGGGQCI